MKRIARVSLCITVIMIISILFCLNVFAASPTATDMTVTVCKSEESERFIWDTLMELTNNNTTLVCGIMGYFWRESGLQSNGIPRWFDQDAIFGGDSCAEYTAMIDAGLEDGSTKELFLNKDNKRGGGYGLGQWFQQHYLEELYDYAQEQGVSIGDARMQCEFMVWSLEHQTPKLWADLQAHPEYTAFQIGRRIGYFYDGAGEVGVAVIESQANEYYKKYGTDK